MAFLHARVEFSLSFYCAMINNNIVSLYEKVFEMAA